MTNQQVTAEEIRNAVRQLVAEITEREPQEVSEKADFIEELGIDSLMAIEILVAVDKKYKIEIPEEEFGKIRNVYDAVEVVQRHLGGAAKAQ
ncbi:MAG: acyl carrier protein [Acidobacteria bacterium]|nr:acyl carrier protein [Acidobacteriota bacterium]